MISDGFASQGSVPRGLLFTDIDKQHLAWKITKPSLYDDPRACIDMKGAVIWGFL